jgi:hypothetical protein
MVYEQNILIIIKRGVSMRMISLVFLVVFMISVIFSAPFFANGADQKDYIRFLPLSYPKIFTQTEANKKFALYGDTTDFYYQDANPLDGIDDHRFKILQKIAVRFAPYLVQNTAAVPMDFKLFMKGRTGFPLYVDTWDVSDERAELIQSRTINFATFGFPCGPSEPEQNLLETGSQITAESNLNTGFDDDDCRLLSLVKEFRPDRPGNESFHTAKRPPRGEIFKVLYVDFPGHDEKSWRAEYEHEFSQRLPLSYQDFVKTYTHFFIHEDRAKLDSRARFEFVIQYWFFYPFNDGGNNHEGDWEHINVVISPLDLVEELLTEGEIKNILQGEGLLDSVNQGEQLVIKRVEYYFHYRVMILDYSRPNVYRPRKEWQKEVNATGIERLAEDWLWKRIRELAYRNAAETEINTHPISYIGGDNKGFDQLLAFPGGKNRDSHGNYPLPGLYQGVGPAGASEAITTNFDHRKHFKAAGSKKQKYRSSFGRGDVVEFDDPSRIEVVPDWECVIDLLENNPEARQEWSWLVLPIRWGYPATLSPFAGVVAHADTGNLAPLGPAFRDGWNLVGSSVGYELYWPHKFPSLFPLEWQDSYQNSLGFLNLTYPTLANLPPFDLIWRVVAAPFRAFIKQENPTFYKKEAIPFRFMGLSGGVFVQTIPEEFVYLGFSPAQLDEILERLYQLDPQLEFVDTREVFIHDKAVGPMLRVVFFMGKRFMSENTLCHSRSDIGDDVSLTNRADPFKIRSELNMWEYAGSLRYNFVTGHIQPFVKAGYGLSWYRLENLIADGEPLEHPNTPWIRRPSFFPFKNLLPNTWHYGFGIEVIPYKSYADIPRGIDIGLHLEFVNFYHSVGLDFEPWLGDVAEKVGDVKVWRENINFVLTISF